MCPSDSDNSEGKTQNSKKKKKFRKTSVIATSQPSTQASSQASQSSELPHPMNQASFTAQTEDEAQLGSSMEVEPSQEPYQT